MPELPDVLLYKAALAGRIRGFAPESIRVISPFVLQSWDPPVSALSGLRVQDVERIGKRIIWAFEEDLFLVFHLMIAGRFHLRKPGAAAPRKTTLAFFDFPGFRLLLTEAATKKRATLHVVRGRDALAVFRRGGLDVMTAGLEEFAGALRRENHTLKRSLTDPRLFDGIGNAYSDEILHRARLSPLRLTKRLTDGEIEALHRATRETLQDWIDRLSAETGDRFPEKVTAFREGMAVHGRFRLPCPDCGAPVQRIAYAANECNYCARCQTGGRLLADRAWSRLLKSDWPRTLEELEALSAPRDESTAQPRHPPRRPRRSR